MLRKTTTALVLVTACLFATSASAQTQEQQSPAAEGNARPQGPAQQTLPRLPSDRGRRDGGMRGQIQFDHGMRGRMQGMSDTDRTAFFEARLAAIKAGLILNETQQRLWPAVETAVRDMMKQRQDWAERIRKEGQPANPVDRMKRTGELLAARGAVMTKMADAMKPLHDSLSDDQKRRLGLLMRGPFGGGENRGRMYPGNQGEGGMGMRGAQRPRWSPDDYERQGRQGNDRQRWRNGPGDRPRFEGDK